MDKEKKKKLAVKVFSEKPWRRYDDEFKKKILKEISDGILGQREASRKYRIHRRNFEVWKQKFSLSNLNIKLTDQILSSMNPDEIDALKKRAKELDKALQHAKLKIEGLETLINVAEKELRIKIRKKPGSKQSKK